MIPQDILMKINDKVLEYGKENSPKQVSIPAFHDGAIFGYSLASPKQDDRRFSLQDMIDCWAAAELFWNDLSDTEPGFKTYMKQKFNVEGVSKPDAIGFIEWAMDNYWVREPLPRKTTGKTMWAIYEDGKEDQLKTTEQLYEIYKSIHHNQKPH